jgi:uncharacterized membrane protein YccC
MRSKPEVQPHVRETAVNVQLVPGAQSTSERRADPRLVALHRATRAAIVPPATFAFTLLVVRDIQVATFAVFGCFSLLVMADFGGPRPARAAAYVATTCAGAALVALGTALSPNLAAGVAVMLVTAFVLAMAGVFGGYLAASQTALLLAFVLAVTIPGDASVIPTRIAGWTLAGAVSTAAGAFLWPWFERVTLRRRAAAACTAVAALVDAMRRVPIDELARRREEARSAVQAIHTEYAKSTVRPAGPTRRDRAFVELVTELEAIINLVGQPFHEETHRTAPPCLDEGDALAAAVHAALHGSASALSGGPAPDPRPIVRARRDHRAALDRWAVEQLRAGSEATEILDGLDVDHTLRVIAYVCVALSANAVVAAGGRLDEDLSLPPGIPRLVGIRGVATRVARTVRAHLDPTSTVLHHSIRMAAGLALSVLLARTLGLNHGFWVVLGTLSVLRSNALGTGRSTVEALLGSVIGFVLGGLFATAAGSDTIVMWLALPIAIFCASYAASAVGFVAGQAAFTLTVIIIFNLISPTGWQVGLVRIEDVAIGTGISVVVGVLLWPRGARRDLARATSGYYHALVVYLHGAFAAVLSDSAGEGPRVRAATVRARDRAGEAFDTFLSERGAKHLDPAAAARLVSAGNQALLAGDALLSIARDGYRAERYRDCARTVGAEVQVLLARFDQLATHLAMSAADRTAAASPSTQKLRAAAVEGIHRAQADERAIRDAMAVAIAAEWVVNLGWLVADLEDRVQAAVAAARIPWWR